MRAMSDGPSLVFFSVILCTAQSRSLGRIVSHRSRPENLGRGRRFEQRQGGPAMVRDAVCLAPPCERATRVMFVGSRVDPVADGLHFAVGGVDAQKVRAPVAVEGPQRFVFWAVRPEIQSHSGARGDRFPNICRRGLRCCIRQS